MERLLKGCYGIVMTPFLDNGKVDFKTLEQHIRTLTESSITGFVACGSTGEFSRLTPEENLELMKCVHDANEGKKQFICGATAPDTYTTNKYIEKISEMGADAMLIAPPYYFPMSDEEVIAFYDDISYNNSAKVPIVAYNIPQCTTPISVNVFKHIVQLEDIKGMKNSWLNLCEIMSMIKIRDQYRPDMSMLTGLDACLYPTLALGGDGLFTAIAYLLPQYATAIYTRFGDGDFSLRFQQEMLELIDKVGEFSFPHGYRLLAEAAGFPLGRSRMSIGTELAKRSADGIAEMKQIIDKLNYRLWEEKEL